MKNIFNSILRISILSALVFSGVDAFAQTRVSGTVKDSKGEPIIGAAVMLEGNSTVGTVTDIDGKYALTIPTDVKQPRLKATSIGYEDVSQAIGKDIVINFTMRDDSELLDEVVVVGYGSMRKSDLTGSVTSVKIDEGDASKSTSVSDLLQGHAAGVQVLNSGGAPDAGVSIRIRGISTFSSNTEPLYVVDGVIINGDSGSEILFKGGGADNQDSDEATNGLLGLNPNDIASMEILKDASATAIYGALGANGVVLITTKSARKEKPVVNFNAGVDISQVYKKMNILSFDEYGDYLVDKIDYLTNHGADKFSTVINNANIRLAEMYKDPSTREELKVTPRDWQDHGLRTAVSRRYFFSISGRPENTSYTFSLGYQNKQGIIKTTGVQVFTARLNLERTVGNLKFGTRTNFSYINSNQTQSSGGGRMTSNTSYIRSMLNFHPYSRGGALDDSGDEDEELEMEDEFRSSPERWLLSVNFINSSKQYRVTPNIYAQYKIFPWLSFRSQIGGDYKNTEKIKFKSSQINSTSSGSNGATSTSQYVRWNWDNTFNFNKKFGAHSLQGTVGQTAMVSKSTIQIIEGWNINQYKGGIESINTAPNTRRDYSEGQNQTLSFYARLIYNFKDRYVLTATYRLDGASKFLGSNKWSQFPSVAFAWRLSQEPWFNVPAVSMAKIRLGWGRTGNQSIENYKTLSNYAKNVIAAHNTGNEAGTLVGLYPSNLSNPNLKWETTEQVNVGLDVGFWKGRLSLTADAYYKTTYDLLQSKTIPGSSGFTTFAVNEGTINNKGLELTLSAVPVKTNNFEWVLDGNISFNRNKVVSINQVKDTKSVWITPDHKEDVVYFEGDALGTSSYISSSGNIYMEGYPMGLFYGYKVRGIVGVGGSGIPLSDGGDAGVAGQLDYYDLNGNGYLENEDRTIIGNPNPDFTYGFSTTLRYRRLSFYLNFVGTSGNDIINTNSATGSDTFNNRNIYADVYTKAWAPENTNTIYPALGMMRARDLQMFSDFFVEDGSYLRLQAIALNYELPIKKTSKILKGLNVGVSANNLFIWTAYRGWDPDVNSFGNNVKKMGVDFGSYPSSRTFSFDLKFRF